MGNFVVGCFIILGFRVLSTVDNQPRSPQQSLSHNTSVDTIRTDFNDYIWPTDAGRIVSSTFAEYRTSHFHGGIDISTGDDTGFKVFAVRNGYVARVVVGPNGYGKMIWLQHPDGFYSTYAHLRNFKPELDLVVEAKQLELERYPVVLDFQPTDFPVRKGDVIAFTGETGTGSPHLHFEIRDPNKDFVNPLLCKQFTFPDDSVPKILHVALTPLSDNSTINNSFASKVIPINITSRQIFLPEPLHASGSFGFSVDARDRINGSRFKNGVYRHQLYLDDSLLCAVQLDRAPSTDDYQIGLYYDYELMANENGRYEKLYVDSPSRLPFYNPKTVGSGIIQTDKFRPGAHGFRIVTSDFARNSMEVSGTVIFSRTPTFSIVSSNKAIQIIPDREFSDATFIVMKKSLVSRKSRWIEQKLSPHQSMIPFSEISSKYDLVRIVAISPLGATSFPHFVYLGRNRPTSSPIEISHEVRQGYVRLTIQTREAFSSPPTVTVDENSVKRTLPVTAIDYNSYTATFAPSEYFQGERVITANCIVLGKQRIGRYDFDLYPIHQGVPSIIAYDNGRLIIIADSASLFGTAFVEILKRADRHISYSIRPRFTIVDRGVTVKIKSDDLDSRQSIYFRGRGSRWALAASRRSGQYLVADLRRMFGDVALMKDTKPPTVSRLSVPTQVSKKPQVISFRVSDNMSGVEYKELKLYIDNEFVVPEIDGEHRRVVNQLSQPLTRGVHTVAIRLMDRVGNTSEVHRTFTIR